MPRLNRKKSFCLHFYNIQRLLTKLTGEAKINFIINRYRNISIQNYTYVQTEKLGEDTVRIMMKGLQKENAGSMVKVHKHYSAIPKANRHHPAGRGGRHYIQSDLRLPRIEEQDVCLASSTKSGFPEASLPEKRFHRFNLFLISILTDERICSINVSETVVCF